MFSFCNLCFFVSTFYYIRIRSVICKSVLNVFLSIIQCYMSCYLSSLHENIIIHLPLRKMPRNQYNFTVIICSHFKIPSMAMLVMVVEREKSNTTKTFCFDKFNTNELQSSIKSYIKTNSSCKPYVLKQHEIGAQSWIRPYRQYSYIPSSLSFGEQVCIKSMTNLFC